MRIPVRCSSWLPGDAPITVHPWTENRPTAEHFSLLFHTVPATRPVAFGFGKTASNQTLDKPVGRTFLSAIDTALSIVADNTQERRLADRTAKNRTTQLIYRFDMIATFDLPTCPCLSKLCFRSVRMRPWSRRPSMDRFLRSRGTLRRALLLCPVTPIHGLRYASLYRRRILPSPLARIKFIIGTQQRKSAGKY